MKTPSIITSSNFQITTFLILLTLLCTSLSCRAQAPLGKSRAEIETLNQNCLPVTNVISHCLSYSCNGYTEEYYFNEKDICQMIEVDLSAIQAVALMDTLMQSGFRKKEGGAHLKIYATPDYTYTFMDNSINGFFPDRIAVIITYNLSHD